MTIGARGFPLAASYEMFECADPKCGPHIVCLDQEGDPICEMVLSPRMTLALIEKLQTVVHGKPIQ